MTTLVDMIEDLRVRLAGYGTYQFELIGSLTGGISATDSTFTIAGGTTDQGSMFTPGLYEVGTELVYIQNIDTATNLATGVIRAQGGTAAAAHTGGTGVSAKPKYPRYQIKNAINDVILNMAPKVFATGVANFNATRQIRYDLPSDAIGLLDVQYLPIGPSGAWINGKQYRFDRTGGPGSNTGKTITLPNVPIGRPIQVVYKRNPTTIDFYDDFTTSGLPDYARETVIIGAAAALTAFVDTGRVVDSDFINSGMGYGAGNALGAASSLSKYLYQVFQQKLNDLADRYNRENPHSAHWTV